MEGVIKGPILAMGEDINTDDIIPARYLLTTDPAELAGHVFEDMAQKVEVPKGAIIAAGPNFGSGSSREHAPVALKGAGIKAVLAESLARIFLRNCINIGLLALEVPGISALNSGTIELDLNNGRITGEDGTEIEILPVPEFIGQIIDSGGLIPWIREGGLD